MEIKIAVAYHKPAEILSHNCYFPIQVGKSVHPEICLPIQPDNERENISEENSYYCELTAIYWLWKNSNADIKGLFHYRRILGVVDFKHCAKLFCKRTINKLIKRDYIPQIKVKKSEFITKSDDFGYEIENLLNKYDIVTTKKCLCFPSVEKYFGVIGSEYIDVLKIAVKEFNSSYYNSLIICLNSTEVSFANISVMRSALFDEYCHFIFSTLDAVKNKLISQKYLLDLKVEKIFERKLGYLAEILTDVYITYLEQSKKIKVGRLPVIFQN